MMSATLSPGGKLIFVDPANKISLGPDQISNPFIEKADIVNHKMKIHKNDMKRDNIQTMYQRHKTWAQHEEEKKDIREKYFDEKMYESHKKFDMAQEMKTTKRVARWNDTKAINKTLAT